MNPPFLLGWIGVPEALIVLLVLPVSLLLTILWVWMLIKCIQRLMAGDQGQIPWLVAMLVTNGLGAAVYWLFVHRGYQPPPPTPPPTTISSGPAVCPHCRKPLTTLSVQGICPECMLQAGLGTQGPDPSESKFTPPAIDQLAPHFPQLELLELLGRGGMGAVYKARQKELNRLVALKVLPSEKAERDPAFAERFAREARALASLSHPNIVTVFDYGQAGGHCYLLMEYVDGLNLRQLLQRGTMKPEEAVAIVPRICEALQFAHQHGIVHRDIKPENILVDTQGRVKIADFGIAKIIGAETERTNLTEPRQTIGTPHYMAPEQVEKPSTVDHRADIYSLGVVFYEMLTGELPLGKFASPSQKVQVDVRLDEIVLRALEKEPARRYQQASQVKTAVETVGFSASERETAPCARWQRGAYAGLAAAVAVLLIAGLISLTIPNRYSSFARISAERSSEEVLAFIKSEPAIAEVAISLGMDSQFPTSPLARPAKDFLRENVSARLSRNTSLIEIHFIGKSPDDAATVANAFAQVCKASSGQDVMIHDIAFPDPKPVSPNRYLHAFIGCGAALVAGLVVALATALAHPSGAAGSHSYRSGASFGGGSQQGREFRTKATLFGLPLIHFAEGIDPRTGRARVARGIIAIGQDARGVIALGGRAFGAVAFGGLAMGGVTFGGLSLGVVSFGGASIGLGLAIGGAALGSIALGGGAVGIYSMGGGAYGLHALGGNVQDPIAKDFFLPWGPRLLENLPAVSMVFVAVLMLGLTAVPSWLWIKRRLAASV